MRSPAQIKNKAEQERIKKIELDERAEKPRVPVVVAIGGVGLAAAGALSMAYATEVTVEQYLHEREIAAQMFENPANPFGVEQQQDLDPGRLVPLATVFAISGLGYMGFAAASGKEAIKGVKHKYKYSELKKASQKKK